MGLSDPYPLSPQQQPAMPRRSSEPQFFNDHQYALVAVLAALIIPTDEDPGATEAGVVNCIDRIAPESEQKQA